MIASIPSNPERLALIGYNNLLVASTLGSKALTPNTYERYEPAAGAITTKFQLTTLALMDYIAIGAHNIGTQDGGTDVTFKVATTIGGALTTLETVSVSDNGAIMISFNSQYVAEIAIVTNAVTTGMEIGVIYAGEALQMQQPIYGGHAPIDLSSETKYQSTMSDSGQFLGRNIVRQGLQTSFQWQHLEDDWIRTTFKPFIQSAKTTPFFIKWRPDLYESAAFGYTTNDIKPSNMGGGSRLMAAGFSMRAHSDV